MVPAQAASIPGQSVWATYSGLTPAQLTAPGANLIYNPTGVLNTQGWTTTADPFVGTLGSGGNTGYYFINTGAASQASPCQFYQDVAVFPNAAYSISSLLYAAGVSGAGSLVRFYVEWLTSAKAHISYSGQCNLAAGQNWTPVQLANQIAPATAAYARVWMDTSGTTYTVAAYGAAWSQLKIEQGAVCTPYNDYATYGALYQNGATIDSLKPAQANADVTGSNTAAAIAGQAWAATNGTQAAVANANVASGNGNMVTFSQFEKGTTGWSSDYNTPSASAMGTFVSSKVTYLQAVATSTASGQSFNIYDQAYPVPCAGGETLAVSCSVGISSGAPATGQLSINWYNGAGTFLSGTNIGGTVTNTGGIFNQTAIVTAPANTAFAYIVATANATGAGSITLFIGQPMVCAVSPGQTAIPAFTPGPAAIPGADITGANTAAAIAGQSALATNPSYSGLTNVPGVGANYVVNSDFRKGSYAWSLYGGAGTTSVALPNGLAYCYTCNFNQTAALASGSYQDFANQSGAWNGASFAPNTYLMPVTPGDVVYAQSLAGQQNCTFQLYLLMYNAAGTLISAPVYTGAKDYSTDTYVGNGDPAHYNQIGGVVTVPAGCSWAQLMMRAAGNGSGNVGAYFTRAAMGKLAPGQTTLPAYQPGPADPFADATASNTSLNTSNVGLISASAVNSVINSGGALVSGTVSSISGISNWSTTGTAIATLTGGSGTVFTTNVTTHGGTVIINAAAMVGAFVSGSNNYPPIYKLYRDSTLLVTVVSPYASVVPFVITDTPSSGVHTYSLTATSSAGVGGAGVIGYGASFTELKA